MSSFIVFTDFWFQGFEHVDFPLVSRSSECGWDLAIQQCGIPKAKDTREEHHSVVNPARLLSSAAEHSPTLSFVQREAQTRKMVFVKRTKRVTKPHNSPSPFAHEPTNFMRHAHSDTRARSATKISTKPPTDSSLSNTVSFGMEKNSTKSNTLLTVRKTHQQLGRRAKQMVRMLTRQFVLNFCGCAFYVVAH